MAHARMLSEEEKRDAELREDEERYGAKDDGFIPFNDGVAIWDGDTVRLREAMVVHSTYHSLGTTLINIGGISVALPVGAIAAVRRKPPEPLKVGDIVRHPDWPHGERAEIAGIKYGFAAFWPTGKMRDARAAYWPESGGFSPMPRPLIELERVK